MAKNDPSMYSKIGIPLFIFTSSFASCLLPRILANSKIVRKYFSLVNVFTAGLQLSTILVDLIPHMNLKKGAHHHGSDLYPFAASGVCFIALLAIDSIFLHPSEEEKPIEKQAKEVHTHKNCAHSHANDGQHGGDCHENLGTCNTNAIAKSKSKIQALLFLLAISVHSFFEGLAFEINIKHIPLLAGIVFHKILESFSIGASVHDSTFSNHSKLFLFTVYSFLTPFAIVLRGLDFFSKSFVLQQWGNGLCLGALMFVVFFEVIGHSFHGGKDNTRKVFGISLGYLLGCTSIILSHGNHHDHHHDHHHH